MYYKEIRYSSDVKFSERLKEEITRNKVVHLTGYDGLDFFGYYDKISEELGVMVPMDEDTGTEVKTGKKWIEIRYDPNFPLSYRHSDKRQPLHTDGSYESNAPDISFFFCISQAVVGGATTFIDSEVLLTYIELYSKSLFKRLHEVPVIFSKGQDSKTRTIIGNDSRGIVLTWNYFRVEKKDEEVNDLRDDFHEFLERKIVEGGLLFPVALKPGEAVFFQDERLLHGRNSFIANSKDCRFLLKGGFKLWTD